MSGPFPEDSAARKTYPLYSGVLQYFPDALAAVAHHSYLGNEKHNPGQSLHWARGKSDDHLDAAARHLAEGDLVGLAWRALAALQVSCEVAGAPMAPGAVDATSQGPCDGWIDWSGDTPPVNEDSFVEIKYWNGELDKGYASCFDWYRRNYHPGAVHAYRVVKESE